MGTTLNLDADNNDLIAIDTIGSRLNSETDLQDLNRNITIAQETK